MLQTEASGELPGARVGRAAGFGGQGDDLRQLGMLGAALTDDGAHVRRVGGVRTTVVALRAESEVRHVAGEVVIISGMMIAGGLPAIGDGPHDGEVFALLGGERQVLANLHAGRGSLDGIEGAAIGERRLGFHVPHVDVRRAAAKEKQDDGFGRLFAATQRISRCTKQGVRRKLQPARGGRRGHEKRAPIHGGIFIFQRSIYKEFVREFVGNCEWQNGNWKFLDN